MRTYWLVLSAILAALAGCTTTPKPAEPAHAPPVSAATPAATSSPATPMLPPQAAVRTVTVDPLEDRKSGLVTRSVFFDANSYRLHDSDRPLLEAHARYLIASRSALLRIEGNCDERGSREYNIALGQKRAEAVRAALLLLGVPDAKMEAISFGREKPVDLRHGEAAWARNRRVYLNYVHR